MGIDILGIDIMGVDILGIDILALPLRMIQVIQCTFTSSSIVLSISKRFYKCNALLPYIIYLICKFIHPFILIFHQK